MSKTRVPPQAITKVNAERLLKKDLERNQQRAAERKAKREAEKLQAANDRALAEKLRAEEAEIRRGQDAANAIEAAKVDAAALGKSVEEVLADMGLDNLGFPLAPVDAKAKTPYDGPMIALKTARKHYVKGANGIECNGDPLALICSRFTRDETVAALVKALKLPGNPYSHLNPGQQSMNLRNKARAAIKAGTLTMAEVEASYTK